LDFYCSDRICKVVTWKRVKGLQNSNGNEFYFENINSIGDGMAC